MSPMQKMLSFEFKRRHNILNSSLETQQELVSVDLQGARKRLRSNTGRKGSHGE